MRKGIYRLLPEHQGKLCAFVKDSGDNFDHFKVALNQGKKKLGAKIYFWQGKEKDIEFYKKMPEYLIDQAKMFNIGSLFGLTPRVYAVMDVKWFDHIVPCLIMDDLDEDGEKKTQDKANEIYDKFADLGSKWGFSAKKKDVSIHDYIAGKLIDIDKFEIDRGKFKQKCKDYVNEKCKWGKTHYQQVPELGIKTMRRTTDRIDYLKLKDIDFEDKTVLDIGTSSGVFLNYAAEHGAKYCRGLDYKNNADGAFALSTYLGHFNNDYHEADLSEEHKLPDFDIVLMLSMDFHIGLPDWILKSVKELLILEQNSVNSNPRSTKVDVTKQLRKYFKEIKKVGEAKDHGDKPIYHCHK